MAVRPESKTLLLEAGRALLCREAVGAVERLLRPDALAEATRRHGGRPVSRPTAYRVWGSRKERVGDIVDDLTERVQDGARSTVKKTRATWEPRVSQREIGYDEIREGFCEVIAMSFYKQFDSPEAPAGWVLQTAAMTGSRVWQGRGGEPDEEWQELAQEILTRRGQLYEDIATNWAYLLEDAMAAVDRRPKSAFSWDRIVWLMHSLFDGCVLRIFIDPRLNAEDMTDRERARALRKDVRSIAEAMFDMAWAYTEPYSLKDPREPANPEAQDDFNDLLQVARELYKADTGDDDPVEINPDIVAARAGSREGRIAGEDEAAARRLTGATRVLFPNAGDLADSLLRQLVVPPGRESEIATAPNPLRAVRSVLYRLNRVERRYPRVVAAAQSSPPTTPAEAKPFLVELEQAVEQALRSPLSRCVRPYETARRLVALSLSGLTGWEGVRAVLKELGGNFN